MSRPLVFQAKPGPWVHLVRFLLLSSFLLTSPVLSQGGITPWTDQCTVKSSWCSGTQTDRMATYESALKYSCDESDFNDGVLGNGSVQDRYVTEKSFANQPLAGATVAIHEFISITEHDFTPCWNEPISQVYVGRAANISFKGSSEDMERPQMCLALEAPESMMFKIITKKLGPDERSWCYRIIAGNDINNEIISQECEDNTDIFYTKENLILVQFLFYARSVFSMRVEVLPAVSRPGHFQAFCYSDKKGYIQAPADWDGLTKRYLPNTASCITVEIPDHHVIMISFVSFHIEYSILCVYDRFTVHMDAVCEDAGKAVCKDIDYSPTVYEDHQRTISFSFYSDYTVQRNGFRLLYSFHPTYAKPEKLPGGKWNCSVPYYSDFQDHFLCSADVFCQDGRDGEICNIPSICRKGQINSINYGPGQCYHVFQELPQNFSWDDAATICDGFELRLIHLDSTAKWESFLDLTKDLTEDSVFVGSKRAQSADPGMYSLTWRWSNDTLAMFVNGSSNSAYSGCGIIRRTNLRALSTVHCTTDKVGAAFVCEALIPGLVPNDSSSDATSLLPVLPSKPATPFYYNLKRGWNEYRLLMTKCRHNHTAYASLACDVATNCSAAAGEVLRCASDSRFSPAVPFFECDITSQFVPYSLVCDHREDCWDGSDEDFCQFQPCSNAEMPCKNKKQCINKDQFCDGKSNCVDGSDEFQCPATRMSTNKKFVLPPAVVKFTGRGNVVVTAINSTSCPETHFRCPGNGYCMPVYVLCNGVFDCPGKEDEMGCDLFTCRDFYRCRNSRVCVHHENLCDDIFHCPEHDDELYCNTHCPDNCTCYGHAFICTDIQDDTKPQGYDVSNLPRYIEASGTAISVGSFSGNNVLIHLGLRHSNITVIGTGKKLPSLQSLDLSYNQLTAVTGTELSELNNLRYLSLAYNPLILDHLLDGSHVLPHIYKLNFAGINIPELTENFFSTFPNLRVLNVSQSGVNELPQTGFQTLKQLRTLDLSGCSLQKIPPGIFEGLDKLDMIISDNYKLCCPSVLPVGFDLKNCLAPADEVSSCDALLRSEVFRVFLLAYTVLSLVGNLGSFVYKNWIKKSTVRMGFDVFVTHLNISDFLMGIYLAIVGVADRIYYGDYIWNDVTWRHSAACKMAGFLSFLSSEMSAFLICLITLERFLVIRFPFKRLRFSRTSAHVTCVVLWIISFVLSAVPLLPTMEHWEFYSQSGICVPLPITRKEFPGQVYSFSVMIGLNFVLFFVIAVGQGLIYSSIRSSARACKSSSNSKDMAVAHRLLAVVMTDFLCWFPIGLLGIMAKSGVPIPGDVNVGMAIFVLPFNSALNPFLYTFNMVMERRRKAQRDRLAKEQNNVSLSPVTHPENAAKISEQVWTESEVLVLFGELQEAGLLSTEALKKLRQCLRDRV